MSATMTSTKLPVEWSVKVSSTCTPESHGPVTGNKVDRLGFVLKMKTSNRVQLSVSPCECPSCLKQRFIRSSQEPGQFDVRLVLEQHFPSANCLLGLENAAICSVGV